MKLNKGGLNVKCIIEFFTTQTLSLHQVLFKYSLQESSTLNINNRLQFDTQERIWKIMFEAEIRLSICNQSCS